MNDIKVIKSQKVLGKNFKMYGTFDKPLFVAKDVAEWIDYSKTGNGSYNVTQMIKPIDADEKLVLTLLVAGQRREVAMLTENGLYEVLMQSRKPLAKEFKREIKTILKQIRKTGGYIPVSSTDDDATILIKAVGIYERTIKEKDHLISSLLPKAQTYDMIMDADGTFSLNQVAKFVSMGEYNLFQFLRQQGVLFYEGNDNVPYERFRKNKCFKVVMTKDYRGQAHSITKVYPKGVDYICKIISKSERAVG